MEFLEKINLSDNNLSGADVADVLKSLYDKPVKMVNLGKNVLGKDGGMAVLDFLEKSEGGVGGHIEELELEGCRVGENLTYKIMAELLVYNAKSLVKVSFAGNGLKGKRGGRGGLEEIKTFMKGCKKLEEMDLSWNR